MSFVTDLPVLARLVAVLVLTLLFWGGSWAMGKNAQRRRGWKKDPTPPPPSLPLSTGIRHRGGKGNYERAEIHGTNIGMDIEDADINAPDVKINPPVARVQITSSPEDKLAAALAPRPFTGNASRRITMTNSSFPEMEHAMVVNDPEGQLLIDGKNVTLVGSITGLDVVCADVKIEDLTVLGRKS